MLDGFFVVPAYLGQPPFNIVPDLALGDSKLVRNLLLGLSGHFHLDDRLAPCLRDYRLAVLYSHDLAIHPFPIIDIKVSAKWAWTGSP